MIYGISHITFVVSDLERATAFFTHIFDAKEVYHSGDATFSLSKEKFLLIGDLWVAIMEGAAPTERSYQHIAFQICESEFDTYLTKIKAIGAEIKPPRPRIPGEGRSIYFYDFDNHLFELHTGTLMERLQQYQQETTA